MLAVCSPGFNRTYTSSRHWMFNAAGDQSAKLTSARRLRHEAFTSDITMTSHSTSAFFFRRPIYRPTPGRDTYITRRYLGSIHWRFATWSTARYPAMQILHSSVLVGSISLATSRSQSWSTSTQYSIYICNICNVTRVNTSAVIYELSTTILTTTLNDPCWLGLSFTRWWGVLS